MVSKLNLFINKPPWSRLYMTLHDMHYGEKLRKEFKEWSAKIYSYKRIKCNTELFKRIIAYYNDHHGDLPWPDLEPFSAPFKYRKYYDPSAQKNEEHGSDYTGSDKGSFSEISYCDEGSGFSLQLDKFEDLQVLCRLYETLGIATDTAGQVKKRSNIPAGHIFEALFYKPGWAKKHDEWFLEEIEKLDCCRLDAIKVGGTPCAIKAECQIVYMEKHLQKYVLTSDTPESFLTEISKHERLWSLVDKNLFSLGNFPSRTSYSFAAAFEALNGKPLGETYDEDYKNALTRFLHGDSTMIKPIIESRFESVKRVWPEAAVKKLSHECRKSVAHDFLTASYWVFLRNLVLSSSYDVMLEYLIDYGRWSNDIDSEPYVKGIDFDHLVKTDPKRCLRLTGLSNAVHNDFLIRASIENVRIYLTRKSIGVYARDEVLKDLKYIRTTDPERFSNIMLAGDFVDQKSDNRIFGNPDHYCTGFYDDEPCENVTNLERMMCQLPSGSIPSNKGSSIWCSKRRCQRWRVKV